jgi:hypothetical protein
VDAVGFVKASSVEFVASKTVEKQSKNNRGDVVSVRRRIPNTYLVPYCTVKIAASERGGPKIKMCVRCAVRVCEYDRCVRGATV